MTLGYFLLLYILCLDVSAAPVYELLDDYYRHKEGNFLHDFLGRLGRDLDTRGIADRPRVFFSHAYTGVEENDVRMNSFLELIDAYISRVGIQSTYDLKDYRAGDPLYHKMREGVTQADTFLVFYTQSYETKLSDPLRGVSTEWRYAEASHKRMVYMVLEDGLQTQQEGYLYLDFRNPEKFHENIFSLARSLFYEDVIPSLPYSEILKGLHQAAVESHSFQIFGEALQRFEEARRQASRDYVRRSTDDAIGRAQAETGRLMDFLA